MAATITQVQNYISSMRVGAADFVDMVCRKERLGHPNMFCARNKVILVSAYMDCVVDYFTPYLTKGISDYSYADENFFTTDEIRDMMQHINNICGTFYMLDLSEPDQYDPEPTTSTTSTTTLATTTTTSTTTYHTTTTTTTSTTTVDPSLIYDYNGNPYHTVVIGTQEWIVENLRVNSDSIGSIPEISNASAWELDTSGAFCYYDNNINNSTVLGYGLLYNWYAIDNYNLITFTDYLGADSTGWRVPSQTDMETLATYINGGYVGSGGPMKESGTDHWSSPNTGATNTTGFTGIGVGTRAGNGSFAYINEYCWFWTTTAFDPTHYYAYNLSFDTASFVVGAPTPNQGCSVRCVRDYPQPTTTTTTTTTSGGM